MSNPSQNILPIEVKDPILNVESQKAFPILKGGEQITYYTENASSYSDSAFSFNVTTPNNRTYLNRRILMRVPVKITLNGNDPGQHLFQTGKEGFREYPLASAMNTLKLTVNNFTTSIDLHDVLHPFMKYDANRQARIRNNMSPSMPDLYQDYEDGVNTNKNPLASYFNESGEIPRGAIYADGVESTNTKYEATYTIVEPLFISPLQWDDNQDNEGLIYVNSLSVQINWVSNLLSRMWCRASSANAIDLNTSEITFGQPSLILKYVTPPNIERMPLLGTYDYFSVDRHVTNNGTAFGPNTTHTLTSDNIQLRSIPYRVYIWVGRKKSDMMNVTKSDTFFNISRVSLQFNNNAGLLSTANEESLFRIAKDNGFQHSWEDWHGLTRDITGTTNKAIGLMGSVLCLEFGKDIQLPDYFAAGMTDNFNFQIDVTCKNLHQSDTIVPNVQLAFVHRGCMVNDGRTLLTSAYSGVISKSDLDRAVTVPGIGINNYKHMYGAGFFNPLAPISTLIKGVQKGAKDFMKGDWKSGLRDLGEAGVDAIGQQYTDLIDAPGKALSGIAKKYLGGTGRPVGGRRVGGKRINRQDLLDRLNV